MKNRASFLTLNLLMLILIGVIVLGQHKQKNDQLAIAEVASTYMTQANERQEQQMKITNLIQETINEDLPGIVVWGDSLTAGTGGNSVTYSLVLKNLIHHHVYNNIPVINMGVAGESSSTIAGRAGSIPFTVDSFTIPADTSKVEIQLTSSDGSAVAPLRTGDRGLNPVTISGVKGIISIAQESSTSETFTYSFERLQGGEAVTVEANTVVETASLNEFENYIPIISIGQNGGYETNQQLVDQIRSIVNMEKSNEKYLVLGITAGTAESQIQLESLMESVFGEKYVNLRELISSNGVQIAGITPTTEDLIAMESGSIPPSLLSDEVNLNAMGYEVIGRILFDRMQKLGYFDSVLELVGELNEL